MMSSCNLMKNQLKQDREGSLEFQDYRDGLASRLPDTDDDQRASSLGSIPELQPYISQSGERMKSVPLVSISVNQSVPLRDALYELAQQADYDIELDPGIRGSIIFTARNRPFDEVVERIANIAGLRYKLEDDILRVEVDNPYNKVYKIDYLSYVRNSNSSISNNISVVSGSGADSGSNFEANSESEINFWGELEANLEQIVRGAQTGALKTRRTPRITATSQNPDVQAVAPTTENGQVVAQAPEAVLNVEALPLDEEEVNNNSSSNQDDEPNTFTINKQAGLISVYANEKAHKEVASYLKLLKKAVTSQVLIEAKILEVTLNDEHATGVNWDFLGLSNELGINLSSAAGSGLLGVGPGGTRLNLNDIEGQAFPQAFTAAFNGNDIQALIGAISRFGTVKALASPRLTVLNNQSAVLNVATNRVFFELEIDTTTEDGTTNVDVDSDIRNVPEGVLVNVQPSINLDDQTISMAVRPTITSILGQGIEDPGVAIAVGQCGAPCTGITSLVPELNVQEIDSVIKTRSGQPVVMGGLLQDRVVTTDSGVPVLGETPVLGSLFKDHNDRVIKTELVIFLKATILDGPGDSIHVADKDLYRQFSSDRRPLRF